jgi:hypothetical protein
MMPPGAGQIRRIGDDVGDDDRWSMLVAKPVNTASLDLAGWRCKRWLMRAIGCRESERDVAAPRCHRPAVCDDKEVAFLGLWRWGEGHRMFAG